MIGQTSADGTHTSSQSEHLNLCSFNTKSVAIFQLIQVLKIYDSAVMNWKKREKPIGVMELWFDVFTQRKRKTELNSINNSAIYLSALRFLD